MWRVSGMLAGAGEVGILSSPNPPEKLPGVDFVRRVVVVGAADHHRSGVGIAIVDMIGVCVLTF